MATRKADLNKYKLFYCSLVLVLNANPVLAGDAKPVDAKQVDAKLVDKKLAVMMNKISEIKSGASEDFQKLEAANNELLKYIKSVCQQPQLMLDPLKKAVDAGMSVVSSDDKKLRYYSWDTQTGGTMHVFYSLVAYDAGNRQMKYNVLNPKTKDNEGDPGTLIETLNTIKTNDGKTVYMMQELMIGSGLIHGRTISAFVISNGKLVKYPFFQASKKLLDSISYDFAEYGDGTEIQLSDDKKKLGIPLIKPAAPDAPSSGTATGKYLNYFFDGSRYVFGKGK